MCNVHPYLFVCTLALVPDLRNLLSRQTGMAGDDKKG